MLSAKMSSWDDRTDMASTTMGRGRTWFSLLLVLLLVGVACSPSEETGDVSEPDVSVSVPASDAPKEPEPTSSEAAPVPDYGFPDHYPAEYAQIVEGSRDEQKLTIYGILPTEHWDKMLAGFKELYPWIEVEALDLGTSEVFERYAAEVAAGASDADLIQSIASGQWWIFTSEEAAFSEYESPETDFLPDVANPLPGIYTMSSDPLILLFNKAVLTEDQQPGSMEELVGLVEGQPEVFDGKITTYNVTEFFTQWWWIKESNPERFESWFSVLGPASRPEAGGGTQFEKVSTGEYVVSYYMSSAVLGLDVWDGPTGDILGWAIATDSVPLLARNIGIPATSDSPNSARLLLDYLLSEVGQELVVDVNLVPVRDVAVPEGWFTYASLSAGAEDGALVMTGPAEALTSQAEFDAFVAEWNSLFGR